MVPLRQVFDDLVRFETVLWAALDHRLRQDCDVSLASLNVMLVIESTPNCRVLDIADALAITVGGVSQAVDRVERSGWCRRRPNPADRRSSILELTDSGKDAFERCTTVFDAELARHLVDPLSATALNQLGAALATLRRTAFDAAPAARRPAGDDVTA